MRKDLENGVEIRRMQVAFGVFLLGYFCVLLGVFDRVFLRISSRTPQNTQTKTPKFVSSNLG